MVTKKWLDRRASEHRQTPTHAEKEFRTRLDRLGIEYLFQPAFVLYIPDFVILLKLIIVEVDGGYHDDPEQKERDAERDAFLEDCGFRVIHVRNEDVNTVDLDSLWGNMPTYERDKAYGRWRGMLAKAEGRIKIDSIQHHVSNPNGSGNNVPNRTDQELFDEMIWKELLRLEELQPGKKVSVNIRQLCYNLRLSDEQRMNIRQSLRRLEGKGIVDRNRRNREDEENAYSFPAERKQISPNAHKKKKKKLPK